MEDNKPVYRLDLEDFMRYFDPNDPYHLSAISELQSQIPDELLRSDASWFVTWSTTGKRADPYYSNLPPQFNWPYKENPYYH